MSARTNIPSATKKMEELEETVAQERERIYQTGSKGRKNQKRGKEQRLTTRTGAKAVAKPKGLQVEEDTAQKGGYKTQRVKTWKNHKNRSKRDNRAKGAPNRFRIREEQGKYGMPTTRTSVKPGRETIASHTNSTQKDKNKTHGKEASQKDAGSQTSRHGPQLRETLGPKRKNMLPAQMTTTREPLLAKAPPPKGQGQKHLPAPRRPKQEDAQNPAHPTRTARPTCRVPLKHQHCLSPQQKPTHRIPHLPQPKYDNRERSPSP